MLINASLKGKKLVALIVNGTTWFPLLGVHLKMQEVSR